MASREVSPSARGRTGSSRAHHLIQVERLDLENLPPAEGQELLGDGGGPLGCPPDVVDVFERRRVPDAIWRKAAAPSTTVI